jgi:hypothetical protein
MLALGASRADVGQGEQSWVVLADPEGCARRTECTEPLWRKGFLVGVK